MEQTLLERLKRIDVVLGSQSPRRKELLRSLDIAFTVEVRDVEERIDRTLTAPQVVEAIAQSKLEPFLRDQYADKLVIVADTLVANDEGFLIGKPKSLLDAEHALLQLSGRDHIVYTAVAMAYQGRRTIFVEETKVSFSILEAAEIKYYVQKYQPTDKAGAYGIQEWIGRMGIERIEGSYENVVGLPTARLYRELKHFL